MTLNTMNTPPGSSSRLLLVGLGAAAVVVALPVAAVGVVGTDSSSRTPFFDSRLCKKNRKFRGLVNVTAHRSHETYSELDVSDDRVAVKSLLSVRTSPSR